MSSELQAALTPFLAFIETNDTDTLARLKDDDKVVATATNSWRKPASITIGDFRRLYKAANEVRNPIDKFDID